MSVTRKTNNLKIKFHKIIQPDTKNYWPIQENTIKTNENIDLNSYISPMFYHIDDIYYTIERVNISEYSYEAYNIIFWVDKYLYDPFGNPLPPDIVGQLQELKEYKNLGALGDIKYIIERYEEIIKH